LQMVYVYQKRTKHERKNAHYNFTIWLLLISHGIYEIGSLSYRAVHGAEAKKGQKELR